MRRWPAVALVACVSAAALWLSWPRESPDSQYTRALQLLRNGDFDTAAAEAAAAERHSRTPEWRSRFRLLEAEALLENGKGDRALSLLAATDDSGSVEDRVRGRVLRARRLIAAADLAAAGKLLEEARTIATVSNSSALRAEVELSLGQVFGRQRRLAEAEASFVTAREGAKAAGDQYRLAAAVNNLGMVRMIRSRCDEAIPLFEQALRLYEQTRAEYAVAFTRKNIGLCYSQLGDLESAFQYRQAALGLSRPSIVKASALGETGTVLLADDPAKAAPYYRQARDMALQFGAKPEAARWAGNLASALASAGDWKNAEAALSEAKTLGAEPRSRVYLDLTAASIELGNGHPSEARAIYQQVLQSSGANSAVLWEAHAGIAGTWIAANDTDKAVASFRDALEVVESAQSDLNRTEHRITYLAKLMRLYQNYVELLVSRNDVVGALAVADRSRARLLSERLSRNIRRGGAATASDFQSAAGSSRSVWLSYWLAAPRSFLWVVTPSLIKLFTLPAEPEITSLVKEYRTFIESGVRDPLQTPSDAGRKLYEILIAPAAPMLTSGQGVVVVPDGPLHQLSFDTLPVYEANPHYLADDHVISIAPSFGVFSGRRPERITERDALIIGDPVSPAPAWPPLQYASREIAAVAKRLQSDRTVVITKAAARPSAWKTADPGRFSIIHIAAHAEANERSPLDSAVILSDDNGYRLYAREIIDRPLRADLVCLSACRTSGARAYRGEGVVGFAWAFLHAGARSVIAGLWDVADESASMLMDRLYAGIAAGEPPAIALRNARLEVRRSVYSKPFYWGAFQLYMR